MSDHEIFAIRYATNQERRSAENFLGGDPHDVPMPMDFFVWAVVGPERTILVDTGFDDAAGRRRGRDVLRPVDEGLKQVCIDPATIENVVVTHLHWDHAGNHGMFPKAVYHLQDSEMNYCTGRCMCHEPLRRPFDVEDVTVMVRRVFEGRVRFHEGSVELAPGLSLHWTGGHSKGLQVVRVRTQRGWVVLASDASHYYANMEQGRPFPLVHSVEDMMEGYRLLTTLAESPAHIIPGHDPEVLRRYPRFHVDIPNVVRLDLPPKS